MRIWPLIALAACDFSLRAGGTDGATPPDTTLVDGDPADVMIDTPTPVPVCPQDPTLRLCFSFDQPFTSPLDNLGTGTVGATHANVTRIDRAPGNGAAQFSAQSSMRVAQDAEVSNIATLELVFRADALPANRAGLLDSNTTQNLSLFFHAATQGFTFRCGIGNQTENFLVPVVASTWHHVACVCESGALTLYVDGVAQPPRGTNCGAGAIIGDGFTIGSNNTGNANTFDDQLVGAFDYVRLWSEPRSAAQIAAAATASATP